MNNEIEKEVPEKTIANTSGFARILWRVFILFVVGVIFITGSVFVIGFYYQDEVKEYIVAELNKQLNTEVVVEGENIDFTVIQNFPFASVDFKNVKALEAIHSKHKDTLFSAGRISLQFNIIDVFKKDYRIKKIEIDDVNLKIRIDKDGNDNYHFWKESSDSTNASFAFSLESIVLNKIQVSYKNVKSKQTINFIVKNSDLSGNFSDEKYSLESTTDLFVNTIRADSVNYLRKKNIHAEMVLNVDNSKSSYKIEAGKIKVEDLLFEVFGDVSNNGNEPSVNFKLKGKDMNIKSVLSLIPNKYKAEINNYESDGAFYFDATIKGEISNGRLPKITADFGVNDADIREVKEGVKLHHVNLKGHYFSGDNKINEISFLSLKSFSAMIEDDAIEGDLTLKNLDNPSFVGKVKANLNLKNLQDFLKIDTVESISGVMKIDASFSGDGKSISSGNYENITTSGNLSISSVNLHLKNYAFDFSDINGGFNFDNNDLEINTFSGRMADSDFELKGVFRNIISFMIKEDQYVEIDATLNSKKINLNELLSNKGENSGNSNYKLVLSDRVVMNMNTEIEHLIFRKFEAKNISGLIKLRNKKMVIDPIVLQTMDGSITTSGLIDGSDSSKLLVTFFSEVNKINITKMFDQFENFGQSSVTDKNLKGIATAKIQFATVMTSDLKIDLDKLYAGVDMTIENGELNNVESMKSLSRFIELKDLENVRFSTLKNQIEVKNQIISFPKMEVKSNAVNIVASGTHTFKNDINYKIKLSLNELLSKKAKQAKKENDEFGVVADDGLGRTNIFLSMTGTIEKPVIKYDSKSAIQNVKQDLKVEKQTLKLILKDEFGLFKKDSTLKNNKKQDDAKFIIKWEEEEKKQEKKELKAPKKKEEEDF